MKTTESNTSPRPRQAHSARPVVSFCILHSAFCIAVAALCAATAGCRHGYVDPNSVHFDRPERNTLSDVKSSVAALVTKMQDDEGFQEHYELLASKKPNGDLPVLQIGNIENLTTDRVAQKLESARRRLEIALRKTRLFDITDDAASAESVSETLADSIVKNAEVGLKGGDNVQHFGEHVSADYQMDGRYRCFRDGDRYTYELSLQLIDIATGKQIWSDLAEVAKE